MGKYITIYLSFILYRKIPIISSGPIFVQKDFFLGLFSGELQFSEGLIMGGNFSLQNGLDLTIETALKTTITA